MKLKVARALAAGAVALTALLGTAPRSEAYSCFLEGYAPTRIPGTHLLQGHVDAATGAFLTVAPCGGLQNPGIPLSAAIELRTQDQSWGPCGEGSSCPYDWFVVYSYNSSTYELVGPGNQHYAFNSTQGPINTNYDTLDPFLLGAIMYDPYGGVQVNGTWYYYYVTFKDGSTWYFDYYGGLALQVDPHGNSVAITRDGGTGFVTQVTSGANSSRWVKYNLGTVNGATRVVSIQTQYSAGGGVKTWSIGYGSSSPAQIATLTQPDGGVWHYTWGSSYTRSDGAVLPLLTQITNPRGNVSVTLAFDTSGRVSTLTNAAGGVYHYSWSQPIGTNGTVTATAPGGGSTSVSYYWELWHNTYLVTAATNALNETTTFNFNGAPNYLPLGSTDYRGRVTNFGWDAKGNATSRSWTTPLGQTATESFGYDPATSALTSSTDALGRATTYTVNACGDTLTTTDPRGHQSSVTWDSTGNPTAVTNALSQTTHMTYGSCAELLTTTDPLNHTTTRTYDGFLRPASLQDANGKTVTFTYDSMDRVLTQSQVVGGQTLTTTNVYDADGNRTQMTDPKGQVWQWSYDNMDRVASETDPTGHSIIYSYDANSNVSGWTDRAGNSAAFTYDAANRPLTKTYTKVGGAPDSTVTCHYDATTHLLTSIVDSAAPGSQTWSYVYDSLDRTTAVTMPYGTVTIGLNDKLNRRDSVQSGAQGLIAYGFDNNDNTTSITQNGATASLTYDALDRLTQQSLPATPNPVTTARAFDAAGFLTSVTSTKNGTTLDSHTYTRDAVGNITQEVIGGANPSTSTFGYDDLYRLTSATVAGTSYTWSYDAVGNRTAQTLGTLTSSYTYDGADHLLTVNGYPVTSDLDGNVTRDDAGGTYSWDVRGRLIGRVVAKKGTPYVYQYGPDNLRVLKSVNGVVTTYLLDGDQVVTDTINGTLNQTLYGPGTDHPLARNGEYFLTNHESSTTGLTDGSGTLLQSYGYRPFGELLNGGADSNPFQYTGRENDSDSLFYYRARYYNPLWGRFLSADPVGFDGGINPYVYADNNPVNETDPMGLHSDDPGWVQGLGNGVGTAFGLIGGAGGFILGGGSGILTGPAAVIDAPPLALGGAAVGSAGGVWTGQALVHGLYDLTTYFARRSGGQRGQRSGGGSGQTPPKPNPNDPKMGELRQKLAGGSKSELPNGLDDYTLPQLNWLKEHGETKQIRDAARTAAKILSRKEYLR